jgi:hypothetical protein
MASSFFGSSLTAQIFRFGSLTTFIEKPGPFILSGVYDHRGRSSSGATLGCGGSGESSSDCWEEDWEKCRAGAADWRAGREDRGILHCRRDLREDESADWGQFSAIGIGREWNWSCLSPKPSRDAVLTWDFFRGARVLHRPAEFRDLLHGFSLAREDYSAPLRAPRMQMSAPASSKLRLVGDPICKLHQRSRSNATHHIHDRSKLLMDRTRCLIRLTQPFPSPQ